MAKKRKITIKDVAKYTGVSVATVSNVVNGIDKTSEETRDYILKAIKDIGYQPNLTARSLASGKSSLIGIMLPIIEEGDDLSILLKNNPFYSEFISGIEYISRRMGYDVIVTGIEKQQKCKEWLNKRNIDGIILLGMYPKTFFDEIKELKLPIVLIDTFEQYTSTFNRITIDDELGGYLATKHLLELGHKRIALVTGNINNSEVNYRRYKGYIKALAEADINYDKDIVLEDLTTIDGGFRAGMKIMELNTEITAVFANADIVALGVIKAFKKNGRNVPKDYSVVGFDDINFCEYISPSLTTIHQDIYQKGITAAEVLINDIEGQTTSYQNVQQPIELIIRESTRSIK